MLYCYSMSLLYSWVSMVMILCDTVVVVVVVVVVDDAVVAVGGVGTTVVPHDDNCCYECPVYSDSDKYFFD